MIELGTSKRKTMSWTKLTACFESIFAKGLASIHLVNLSTTTSRFRLHSINVHVMGMVWSPWAGAWICLAKYWHPCKTLRSGPRHRRPLPSKSLAGSPFRPCSWTKHDVHIFPHGCQEITPYLPREGCITEGYMKYYDDTTHHHE
jgi:hypothetical protein